MVPKAQEADIMHPKALYSQCVLVTLTTQALSISLEAPDPSCRAVSPPYHYVSSSYTTFPPPQHLFHFEDSWAYFS